MMNANELNVNELDQVNGGINMFIVMVGLRHLVKYAKYPKPAFYIL